MSMIGQSQATLKRLAELKLTPRIFIAAIGMSALICLIFIDQTGNWRRLRTAEIEAVQTPLAAIRNLDRGETGEELQKRVAKAWAPLKAGLLADKTKGLNSARLQKAVADALKKCNISNVYMDIDDRPSSRKGYVIYTVSMRSRDRKRYFPTCLLELQHMDVALVIETMDWVQANGAFRISLKAMGRQG